jgi:thymidylate synthase
MVEQYLEHSKVILSSRKKPKSVFVFNERRGVGRISIFGYQNRYDLREGFPALTTKRIGFKTVSNELIWFLHGETNIKYLVDNKVHIWDDDAFRFNLENMVNDGIFPRVFSRDKDMEGWENARNEYVQRIKEDSEFASRWGELGPVYGSQWLHWPKFLPVSVTLDDGQQREVYIKDPNGIDQIASVIEGMKKNLTSSRHLVTAWNPIEVPSMALPPCHSLWQLNSDGERLNLQLYQRSCDMFLGVPFNIASYSMVTIIMAQQLGLQPGEFVHTFGDVHFYTGTGERAKWYKDNFSEFKQRVRETQKPEDYEQILSEINKISPPERKGHEGEDHVTGILEQLQRTPRQLPKVIIADKPYNELTINDFKLEGYDHYPSINRKLIVG